MAQVRGVGGSSVDHSFEYGRLKHATCVHGPGKSNVLDAICFASGCPASALRVKTLKELVHQDTATEVSSHIALPWTDL